MSENEMLGALGANGTATWRVKLGQWVESPFVQRAIVLVILFNAVILGLETDPEIMAHAGP